MNAGGMTGFLPKRNWEVTWSCLCLLRLGPTWYFRKTPYIILTDSERCGHSLASERHPRKGEVRKDPSHQVCVGMRGGNSLLGCQGWGLAAWGGPDLDHWCQLHSHLEASLPRGFRERVEGIVRG